jgi:hypothetical protein
MIRINNTTMKSDTITMKVASLNCTRKIKEVLKEKQQS